MLVLQDILPAGQAFREGSLVMPGASAASVRAAAGWLGCEVNAALVSVAVILFLIGLRDLYYLLPSLGGCLVRWRANVTIEHNVQLSRDRTYEAAVCLLGFCLLLDRIGFAAPSFVLGSAAGWHVPLRLSLAAGYLLLRRLVFSLLRMGRMPSDARKASLSSLYNYFITVALLAFCVSGVMMLFGAAEAPVRAVIAVISVVGFALAMIRKFQILSGYHSFLSSFSYLCALEFIPAAGLAVCSALM